MMEMKIKNLGTYSPLQGPMQNDFFVAVSMQNKFNYFDHAV